MIFKIPFNTKARATWHSITIVLITYERSLLAFVNDHNVFLECIMFPEFLPAVCKRTSELLSFKMLLVVPLQSGRGDETFAATVPRTDMVPLVFVRGLNVVLEVGGPKEILRTWFVRTYEGSVVGMRV